MKKFNQKKIEKLIRKLLIELNDNPDRPGLIETPKRVAKMYQEIFEGQLYTNQEIAAMFDKCFDIKTVNTDGLVIEKDISAFSTCEHHLATMYDMKISIGYIPKNKVIGLSKLNRICQMCAKRLQLQEKLGEDILEVLKLILETDDIAVFIKAKHMCVAMRGIKDIQSSTVSSKLSGRFMTNSSLRAEFLSMIKE
jgi:GTP cyclohydrolase I